MSHPAGKAQRRKRKGSLTTRNRKMTTKRRSSLHCPARRRTSVLDSSSLIGRTSRSPLEEIHVDATGIGCGHTHYMDATPPGLSWIPGWVARQRLPRPCPLPTFSWADSEELWTFLLLKDEMHKVDPGYLEREHSILTPRMRAILLDWLIEVSEVYKLHRETFYLAACYCDRFLACQCDVAKEKLQLIGVTTLFIAAKMEEIYPPKLTDFAYVTDGACSEQQILDMEIIIIEALEWALLPVTPNAWLNIFLQLANVAIRKESSENFIYPRYSARDFVKIMQLLDLCVLDIHSLQYTSSVLAASAFYLVLNDDFQWEVTGQSWEMISACAHWMLPFFSVLRQRECPLVKQFDKVARDNVHNIQTHMNGLDLLDKVGSVPCLTVLPPVVPATLTPPGSTQK